MLAGTVASPIEQEINGVDNMIYMVSQSIGDGTLTIDAVFKPGTDVDQAQVLVQNRVSVAIPRLPDQVQKFGVTVRKKSPDLMLVIHLISPDGTLDQQYISNYATINIKDVLTRVDGVGDTLVFGARDFSMRIWLDPAKIQARGLAADDVVSALRTNNVAVSAGAINQPPAKSPGEFQIAVQTLGRLASTSSSATSSLEPTGMAASPACATSRGWSSESQDYTKNAYLNDKVATAIAVFQRPGSNALSTAKALFATMEQLAKDFPPGLSYRVAYDTTGFIKQSVDEVIKTLFEAAVLVVIVYHTFPSELACRDYSNRCDSRITSRHIFRHAGVRVFAEQFDTVRSGARHWHRRRRRHCRRGECRAISTPGLSPKEAAHKTMDEVGGALIAIALVLCAVFIPTAFITGISGAFYKQFALTITTSTIISCFVSLTLSPALAGLLLKPHDHEERKGFWATAARPIDVFFSGFNRVFDKFSSAYGGLTRRIIRLVAVMLVLYLGLIGLAYFQFARTPSGFVPPLHRGYFITAITLPPGASLERTDRVVRKAAEILLSRPGVANAVTFAGFDGATFTNAPNSGVIFVTLKPFEERVKAKLSSATILNDLRSQMQVLRKAFVLVIPPPSVPGIGTGGGFPVCPGSRWTRPAGA